MADPGGDEAEHKGGESDKDGPAGQHVNGAPTNDGRPQNVELLLDGERPEWTYGLDVKDLRKVDDEERREQDFLAGVGNEQGNTDQAEKVQGKNAQGALPVEVPVEGWALAILDQ